MKKTSPQPITEAVLRQVMQDIIQGDLRQVVREEVDSRLNVRFSSFEKQMMEKIDDTLNMRLSLFEGRIMEKVDKKLERHNDQMYNLVDSVLSEIKDMRDEHATDVQMIPALRKEVIEHEDRLTKVEEVVFA